MEKPLHSLTRYLTRSPKLVFIAYTIFAAFTTYFCMYAFRKPFSAATYEAYTLWGVDYKIVLIISQVLGYMASKFIGIKVVSEMSPAKRARYILLFIGIAELALLGFALVPAPYNFPLLFINGLPLGMVFGLVFGYLEGRKVTEIIGVGFGVSVIIASGVVKSVGRWLIVHVGVPEFWMPFTTGLIFALPLLLAVFMLSKVPPPSAADEAARTKRVPMDRAARRKLFLFMAPGIITLVSVYVLLSAFRDVRDLFSVELWAELGVTDTTIFAKSESFITFIVMGTLAFIYLIKSNRIALWVNLTIIFIGGVVVAGITYAFHTGLVSPLVWMVGVGLGLFLAYTPYQCLLFERLLAAFKREANVGFLFYIADSMGYLGSVLILLMKNFFVPELSWKPFFITFSYALAAVTLVFTLVSAAYFRRKLKSNEPLTVDSGQLAVNGG